MKTRVVIIGGATGREHAFAKQFAQQGNYEITSILWVDNPFVRDLSTDYLVINLDDVVAVHAKILEARPDYVIVGQGEVTQRGIRDMLDKDGIPCIAPTQEMARIEGSKAFFRGVVESLDPDLVPRYMVFTEYTGGVKDFMTSLGERVVIKKDSTVSGPRVRIYDLAEELEEALKDAEDWIQQDGKIVVEEFFEGKEVAIMSFTDGKSLIHSPPFRNHKRIYDGDEGENTSGMGTLTTGEYLPFMTQETSLRMHEITEQLLGWIRANHEDNYLGSLYGEFLVNGDDIKVIEYNCRFGNPSSMNLIALMRPNFAEICESILNGRIGELGNVWREGCSLSAYVVPKGYPYTKENVGAEVDFSRVDPNLFYCGNMNFNDGTSKLKRSRGFAVCVVGNSVDEVRERVYGELEKVEGPIHYRKDMGLIF